MERWLSAWLHAWRCCRETWTSGQHFVFPGSQNVMNPAASPQRMGP